MVQMQATVRSEKTTHERGSAAVLFLDGTRVGRVAIKGSNATWSYGDFTPESGFSAFAPIYGRWSLLMHAQADSEKLDRATADELSGAERLVDAVKAQLYFTQSDAWVVVTELTIANELLEWREY